MSAENPRPRTRATSSHGAHRAATRVRERAGRNGPRGPSSILMGTLGPGLCLLAASCGNNVGRAFDPGFSGPGAGPAGSQIQLVPEGGIVRSERPRALRAAPSGGGIHATTPILVLFDESMNLASLRESSTETPSHLYVRAEGTEEAIGASYDLLLGGRLAVIRPNSGLPPNVTYEIVAGSGVRDIDRSTVRNGGVLESFTTDASIDSPTKVIFSYPQNGDTNIGRKDSLFVAFASPVDVTTVNASSLFVRASGQTSALTSGFDYPTRLGGGPDPRLVEIDPQTDLDPVTEYDLVYTSDILVGGVQVDVGSRNPPVQFTTMAPLPASGLVLGNPVTGFESSVNLVNLAGLLVDLEVPAGTLATDEVLLRVYGVASSSTSDTELSFFEKTLPVGSDGAGTVQLSLAGDLGTVASPRFKDGTLQFAANLSRGDQRTGFVLADDTAQDTVAPTLTELGPPRLATGQNFLTDQGTVALHGTASEELGSLTLTVGATDYGLFGSSEDGRFLSNPFFLLRTTTPTGFTLSFRDLAGNPVASAVNGNLVQRGVVTGDVSGGTMSVVAYDESTLQAVSGATVLIEPGRPAKPATGRQTAVTDANGLASFGGLVGASYTVTIVADGYELVSVIDTSAAFYSLPLRPLATPTASVSGSFTFVPSGTSTARVGLNLLADDADDYAVQTTTSAPTVLPSTAVRPGRLLFVSAFEASFPPTTTPAYSTYSAVWGASSGGGGSNRAPVAPVDGGGTYAVNAPLVPTLTTSRALVLPFGFDLSSVPGLNGASLSDAPRVSMLASLGGFAGMTCFGVGYTTGTAPTFQAQGSYSLAMLTDFASLGPIVWVSAQAEDTSGNLVRHRAIVSDVLAGLALPLTGIVGVPTVTAPSGNFTGSPAVVFADRIDSSSVANSLAFHEIRATDVAGRRWLLIDADGDAASGTNTLQIPDLAGTGLTGLSVGNWSIDVQTRWILAPGLSASDYNLEDLRRFESSFSRATAVTHVVQ